MKLSRAFTLWLSLFLFTASEATAQQSAPAEPKTVRVNADGVNRDQAIKQALRMAIEQVAGVQLAGYSQVQDFVLIRDTIYSRAFGVVQDYKVLEERVAEDGGVRVTVEATVRPDAIAQTWGEVQHVLDQIGRPRIMVWIDESIDDQPQKDSIVAAKIEEMLVKSGFDLVARDAVEQVRRRESADAADERNYAKQAALAKNLGAHLLIRGVAHANRAGIEDLYGVPAAFYNCDALARVYHTDTGRLLVSESLPVTRAGARSRSENSPQAARAALASAALPDKPGAEAALAERVYQSVMEQWSTQITSAGDIELEVESIAFKDVVELKKALLEVDGVRSVDSDFSKGIAKFRVKAQMSAEALAERLTQAPFDRWVEVVDLTLSRIQAKAAPKP